MAMFLNKLLFKTSTKNSGVIFFPSGWNRFFFLFESRFFFRFETAGLGVWGRLASGSRPFGLGVGTEAKCELSLETSPKIPPPDQRERVRWPRGPLGNTKGRPKGPQVHK